MKKLKLLVLSVSSLILFSCASGYQEVEPTTQNFSSSTENNGVLLHYKYNVLSKKKYKKKAVKKGVNIAAVKLTNNSGKDLIFGKNIKLVNSNGMSLTLLSQEDTYDLIKQKPGFSLFYLLLSGITLTTEDGGSTNSYPVGLVAGTGLALGNFFGAKSANNKFDAELTDFDIIGKTIKNGETAYGLIGLKSRNPEQINMEISTE